MRRFDASRTERRWGARSPAGALLAAAALTTLFGCEREEARPAAPPEATALLLRYDFEPGTAFRYESRTVERGRVDVAIDMRTEWRVLGERADGVADLVATVEQYEQKIIPPHLAGERAGGEASKLVGARFPMAVAADGRIVEQGEVEGAPSASAELLEAVRASLGSHLLRLPEKRVRHGQRWTVEKAPAESGQGAITTRSRWRVLGIVPAEKRTVVELVCLSTMRAEPLALRGGTVSTTTDFHYRYFFDAAAGALVRMESNGLTTTTARDVPDAGSSPTRTVYEARLRLVETR